MRLYGDVGVGAFAVDFSKNGTIVLSGEVYVQECNGFVFFFFPSELNTWVNIIEALVKCISRVNTLAIATEARATWLRLVRKHAPTIIHIDG